MTLPGTGVEAPGFEAPQLRGVVAASVAEASTYLVLLAAAAARLAFDGPDISGVVGPLHGIAFLAYCTAVLVVREDAGWRAGRTALILLAAAVPLGGFVVARQLERDRSPAPPGHHAQTHE
jgi:integral membrane protein